MILRRVARSYTSINHCIRLLVVLWHLSFVPTRCSLIDRLSSIDSHRIYDRAGADFLSLPRKFMNSGVGCVCAASATLVALLVFLRPARKSTAASALATGGAGTTLRKEPPLDLRPARRLEISDPDTGDVDVDEDATRRFFSAARMPSIALLTDEPDLAPPWSPPSPIDCALLEISPMRLFPTPMPVAWPPSREIMLPGCPEAVPLGSFRPGDSVGRYMPWRTSKHRGASTRSTLDRRSASTFSMMVPMLRMCCAAGTEALLAELAIPHVLVVSTVYRAEEVTVAGTGGPFGFGLGAFLFLLLLWWLFQLSAALSNISSRVMSRTFAFLPLGLGGSGFFGGDGSGFFRSERGTSPTSDGWYRHQTVDLIWYSQVLASRFGASMVTRWTLSHRALSATSYSPATVLRIPNRASRAPPPLPFFLAGLEEDEEAPSLRRTKTLPTASFP
mmetsp:Transcript_22921/g.63635  ORF Transcript_22921/g.63635 Transcript_22921/m.63635 type:complete len:446 (-) Transcript_22921:640-1977(-)